MATGTVEVTGSASERVAADYADVEVSVEVGDDSTEAVQQRLGDASTAVVDGLEAAGVSAERVRTASYRVTESDAVFGEDDTAPFVGVERLYVRCDPDDLSRIGTAVVSAGGTVERIELRLSDDRRAEIRQALLTAAVDHARDRATTIASAMDRAVGSVRSVSTRDPASFSSVVDDALAASADVDLEGGPIDVSASVEATFDLRPSGEA